MADRTSPVPAPPSLLSERSRPGLRTRSRFAALFPGLCPPADYRSRSEGRAGPPTRRERRRCAPTVPTALGIYRRHHSDVARSLTGITREPGPGSAPESLEPRIRALERLCGRCGPGLPSPTALVLGRFVF